MLIKKVSNKIKDNYANNSIISSKEDKDIIKNKYQFVCAISINCTFEKYKNHTIKNYSARNGKIAKQKG